VFGVRKVNNLETKSNKKLLFLVKKSLLCLFIFLPILHMFQGLRTIIYPAPQLAETKAWYSQVLGQEPYFDEPFYVGFNVGGFELGLDPHAMAGNPAGPLTYWGVPDADAAYARLLELGATIHQAVQDVGGGIRVGTVQDPFGNVLGVIQNPHFKLPPES
jgi:predicted enzyme related to lactoylglutathione lyase